MITSHTLDFLTGRLQDNLLANRLSKKFGKRFPGPFGYRPGEDGVDDTFDVSCMTTGEHIVSTYYWEEREHAELVAKVVTACLEIRRDEEHPLCSVSFDEGYRFLQLYPGKIIVTPDECEGKGPFLDVKCSYNDSSIVQVYGTEPVDKLIADYLALAIDSSKALPIPF